MATDNVHWTFWGWVGQPMDVIFPISVAPIDELDEISQKSGRYQRGGGGSKNNVQWTLSVAVIYI